MNSFKTSKRKLDLTRFYSPVLPGFLIPLAGILMYRYRVSWIHHQLLRMRLHSAPSSTSRRQGKMATQFVFLVPQRNLSLSNNLWRSYALSSKQNLHPFRISAKLIQPTGKTANVSFSSSTLMTNVSGLLTGLEIYGLAINLYSHP